MFIFLIQPIAPSADFTGLHMLNREWKPASETAAEAQRSVGMKTCHCLASLAHSWEPLMLYLCFMICKMGKRVWEPDYVGELQI